MILTVTPNAAVDRTYRVEQFRLDAVNRPAESLVVAGGKGINVARVYQALGGKALATGLLGGLSGDLIENALASEGIEAEFVRTDGESRTCIAIIDSGAGTQTELNEHGSPISPRNAGDLLETVRRLISSRSFDFVVMSGSLPPGAPDDLYCDLIRLASERGVRAILDSSGEALKQGVKAGPWMIKPNLPELQELTGDRRDSDHAILDAACSLAASGIDVVAVTMGSRGACAVTGGQAWLSEPPSIRFASAVASGDAFVAAFLLGWNGLSGDAGFEQAVRLATGAGAANAAVIGAGFCSREAICEAAQGVTMRRMM